MHFLRLSAAGLLARLAHFYPFNRGRQRLVRSMEALLPPGDYMFEARLAGGPARIRCSRRDRLAVRLFTFGEDEPHLYKLLRLAVASSSAKPAVFVDIGANLGTLSIRLSRYLGCRSICFEPQPALARLLGENAAANGVGDLVQIHPTALADTEGETAFFINPDHLGESSIRQLAHSARLTVPLKRLDSMIDPQDWKRTAIVKVDVEGFEKEVFHGATKLFAVHRPPIVFEVNLEALGERKVSPREVADALRVSGYTEFYALEEFLFPPANGSYPIANILATTAEHSSLAASYGFRADFAALPRPFFPTRPLEL